VTRMNGGKAGRWEGGQLDVAAVDVWSAEWRETRAPLVKRRGWNSNGPRRGGDVDVVSMRLDVTRLTTSRFSSQTRTSTVFDKFDSASPVRFFFKLPIQVNEIEAMRVSKLESATTKSGFPRSDYSNDEVGFPTVSPLSRAGNRTLSYLELVLPDPSIIGTPIHSRRLSLCPSRFQPPSDPTMSRSNLIGHDHSSSSADPDARAPLAAKLELSARVVRSVLSPGSDVVLLKPFFDRDPAGLRFLEFCFR
jgi:hypothetical protein